MTLDLFIARQKRELPAINSALAAELQKLPRPCQPVACHIINAGGKRLRPLLTVLIASLLGNRDASVHRLAVSMEMLHAATLLHDDILDQADSRRGNIAAHAIFGATQTILAGDALLAAGNAIIASFRNPDLSAAYSRATMQTAAGEILEMASLGNPCATEAEYLEIATGKTACLIAQACALGAIFAGATSGQIQAATEFGENLGVAFQLVDDALDFAPPVQTGKPRGGDLREGKMTIPLQLYRDSLVDKTAFDSAFTARDFTPDQIEAICTAIPPFTTQSLKLADKCLARATQALQNLPSNDEIPILMEMAEYVRQRQN